MSSSASLSLFPLVLSKTPHEDIISDTGICISLSQSLFGSWNFYNFIHFYLKIYYCDRSLLPEDCFVFKITTTILELNQFWNLKKILSGICNDFIIPQDFTSIIFNEDLDKCLWNHYAWNPSFPLAVENQRK